MANYDILVSGQAPIEADTEEEVVDAIVEILTKLFVDEMESEEE